MQLVKFVCLLLFLRSNHVLGKLNGLLVQLFLFLLLNLFLLELFLTSFNFCFKIFFVFVVLSLLISNFFFRLFIQKRLCKFLTVSHLSYNWLFYLIKITEDKTHNILHQFAIYLLLLFLKLLPFHWPFNAAFPVENQEIVLSKSRQLCILLSNLLTAHVVNI